MGRSLSYGGAQHYVHVLYMSLAEFSQRIGKLILTFCFQHDTHGN